MAYHRVDTRRNFTSSLSALLCLFLLLAGCTTLKECAYEGINRDQWQQRQKVIESLQIRPGDDVADLGAGSGYFTFALAKAVDPTGKVYAVDIDRDMTDLIAKRAEAQGAGNIEVILGKPNDPLLPAGGIDLVLTVNVYHHIENRVSYFAHLQKYLKPNGRIAVIEFDRRASLAGLWGHYTPGEFIKREMDQAGYVLQRDFDFLDRQSFLVFEPKIRMQKLAPVAPPGIAFTPARE
jgi:arsenite methyltransferase